MTRSFQRTIQFLLWGFTLLWLTACQQQGQEPGDPNLGQALVSIEVTSANLTLSNPSDSQFSATGTYTDGSRQDITDLASWLSADPGIAKVNDQTSKGLVSTVSPGQTEIVAMLEGVVGQASVTVEQSQVIGLFVYPIDPRYPAATFAQANFSAWALYSDNQIKEVTSFCNWSSADSAIATVEPIGPAAGQASFWGIGSTQIIASCFAQSASSQLTLTTGTVQASYAQPRALIREANETALTKGYLLMPNNDFLDATEILTWAPGANMNPIGVQNGFALLSNTIATVNTATFNGAATPSLYSINPIATNALIQPQYGEMATGAGIQLKAFQTYDFDVTATLPPEEVTEAMEWTSSDPELATVCNRHPCKGLVTATKTPNPGKRSVTITALNMELGLSASTEVVIRPGTEELKAIKVVTELPRSIVGHRHQLKAIGIYESQTGAFHQDLTPFVSWISEDENVLRLDNRPGHQGQLHSLASGQSKVSARMGMVSGGIDWQVHAANFQPIPARVATYPYPGDMVSGTRSKHKIFGEASNGTSTQIFDLTAQYSWNSTGNVLPAKDRQEVLTLRDSFVTTSGTDFLDLVSGTAMGTPLDSLTVARSGTATFTALDISPKIQTLPLGAKILLKGRLLLSDATLPLFADATDLLEWSSANPAIASLAHTEEGVVLTAHQAGFVTLTAKGMINSNFTPIPVSQSLSIQVQAASLKELILTGDLQEGRLHETRRFKAIARYDSNGSNLELDVTPFASFWATNASGNRMTPISLTGLNAGLYPFNQAGDFTLHAGFEGQKTSLGLTIADHQLTGISPEYPWFDLPMNVSPKNHIIATYGDGSTRDVTESVLWSSFDKAQVRADNRRGTRGKLQRLTAAVGSTNLDALLQNFGVAPTINLYDPVVVIHTLTLSGQGWGNFQVGDSRAHEALLSYTVNTNSYSLQVSEDAFWESGNLNVAKVSNLPGERGKVTCVGQGTVTLTATLKGGTAANLNLTCEALTFERIEAREVGQLLAQTDSVVMNPGDSLDFRAKGIHLVSGQEQVADLTENVTWTSSDPDVVMVRNEPSLRGTLLARGSGQATVTGYYRGHSFTIDLSVN